MNTHHTNRNGDNGVAQVIADLISMGYYVYIPVNSCAPSDIMVTDGDKNRWCVEVKSRLFSGNKDNLQVIFRRINTNTKGTRYSEKDLSSADVVAIYSSELNKIAYINMEYVRKRKTKTILLHNRPALNNQRWGYLMFDDFSIFPPA